MNQLIEKLHNDIQELTEKLAVANLDAIRYREEAMALRAMLPISGKFIVLNYKLRKPISLRGNLITHVTYTVPDL